MCICVRAERVKTAIKTEMIMYVKKTDEQLRPESSRTGDIPVDYRDYSQVEKALPVFVVSSKAFQVLSGDQQDDKIAIHGFLSIEDTEVPALQQHCSSLTFRARALTVKRTLIQSDLALPSIIEWTGHGATREALTPQEMESLRAACNPHYDNFSMDLKDVTAKLAEDLKRCLNGFGRTLYLAAHAAEKQARDIVAGWHEEGHYQWNTYKAICRRNGSYKQHNWNRSLTRPLEDNLIVPWTRCFTGEHSALAIFLRNFSLQCCKILYNRGRQLLETMEALGSAARKRLEDQLQKSAEAIMDLEGHALDEITIKQRELNRLATPNIEACMVNVYTRIVKQSGKGSFKRSKELMAKHVETKEKTIYMDAVGDINKRLKDLPTQICGSMWRGLHEIQQRVQNDCNQMMTILTEEQYGLREEVYSTIDMSMQKFRAILDEDSAEQITGLGNGDARTNIFEVNPGAASIGGDSAGGGNTGVDTKITKSLLVS